MNIIEELKWRELLFDVTDEEISKYLEEQKVNFYLGVDPTGDSIHVGHLVCYLIAKRLEMAGHHPVILVGGGTGLIGDPKLQGERKLLDLQTSLNNAELLKKQIGSIFNFTDFVNNYDWIKNINLIEYLRDYGKYFNVNIMLNKDTVKRRLEEGISYTEFSYQILQSLDWHHLYLTKNCTMQIGGQDQWGNITAGNDFIRRKEGASAKSYGFTVPLILKSDGTKFGKTESGTVWLDPQKTSAYEFYQFWINTPDDEVIKRLKQFTFLSKEEILNLEEKMKLEPEKREAQKELAKEITILVHKEEAYMEALNITNALFMGEVNNLSSKEIKMLFNSMPKIKISEEMALVDALIEMGLASSKREAKEFITNGAITLNDKKITSIDFSLSKEVAIEGKYIFLKRGKKKYGLGEF